LPGGFLGVDIFFVLLGEERLIRVPCRQNANSGPGTQP
jgi:hypothetical protein